MTSYKRLERLWKGKFFKINRRLSIQRTCQRIILATLTTNLTLVHIFGLYHRPIFKKSPQYIKR